MAARYTALSSPYLDELQRNIRGRPVPWEGYVRAHLLTANEASLVKSADRQNKATTVDKDPELYASTFAQLFEKASGNDILTYLLSITGDFVSESPSFANAFLTTKAVSDPWTIILKQLDNKDETVFLLTVRILVALAVVPVQLEHLETAPNQISVLLESLISKMSSSSDANLQDVSVQAVAALLSHRPYRPAFWQNHQHFVPPLIKLLKGAKNKLQLQYHVLLVLWLASFDSNFAKSFVSEYDAAPLLLEFIKGSIKEKVVRMSVATLYNLVERVRESVIPALLVNSGLSVVKTLSERKWTDEELIDDLKNLRQTLQHAHDELTTFDEYKIEIGLGRLTWSPPHRSDSFWKENSLKFKDKNWTVTKQLERIIVTHAESDTGDEVTLAVACNDISRLISDLPEAARYLGSNGTKVRIMELLNHSNPTVRYEALKATQALISNAVH